MRMRLGIPAALAIPFLLPACEAPTPEPVGELVPADREAIEAVGEQYRDRVLAGDWDGVAALFHADAVLLPPNQPEASGRGAIRDALEPEPGTAFTGFSVRTDEVEGRGDLAYSRGVYGLEVTIETPDGRIVQEDEGKWLAILRRDANGSWLIYRHTWNSDLPPVPAPQ